MRRICIALIVLMMAMTLVAGGNREDAGGGNINLEGYPVYDQPKTFTIFNNYDNMVLDPRWPVFQKLGEITGIYLESVISMTNSNEQEAYNLMIASGNLADIISYNDGNELDKLGRDGGLIPLNDLIDQYAPNIKKALEENPKFAKDAYSLDGNIYYIPRTQGLDFSEFYWIRTDWLEKLGLEVPTTMDELHDVLYAFRNEDPNGTGVKDEIPLFDRAGDLAFDEYLHMWNSSLDFSARDGIVVYDPLEPDFEVAVKEFTRWYEEGIIDPEIFTRGAKSRDVLLAANQGGFTHDWQSAATYNDKLASEIPGFSFEAIAPPISPSGRQEVWDKRSAIPGWGISSSCEDPIAVIRYFDYCFTEEGNELINWGIQGETFDYDENGQRYYLDNIMHGDTTPTLELKSYGANARIGMIADGDAELALMADESLEAAELYSSHTEWYPEDGLPYSNQRLSMKILPELNDRYVAIMASVLPYAEEMFQSWVLGDVDFDSTYPGFVEELKKRGIEEAIDIVQQSYDAINANI